MLGIEPDILDFKLDDDPTLSLSTNQKVRKNGVRAKKKSKA